MARFQRRWRNTNSIEEGSGEDAEDEVEEEAAVGLEAQDSSRSTEYRGCQVLEVR